MGLDHAFRVLKLIERIDTFKELNTAGWFDSKTIPVDKRSICNAKMACLLASPESLKNLKVFPNTDGSVLFENRDDVTIIWTITCTPSNIKIEALCKTDEADHDITFPANPNWFLELDAKVCILFADWIEQVTSVKATVFFRPAQWRDWRSAKKHFKRMSGHTLPIEAKVAAVIDGTLIWAESVDEFIKKFEEVIGEKWRGQLHE